ncbi:hypothetical protein ABZX30_25135 [Streptomyces sp. NPDC004542]|uniref:hypothetical protein n=1 Tax=Streptomyces sp. NPDC004542 TaxID=3154281 RepID=UPI0033A462AA
MSGNQTATQSGPRLETARTPPSATTLAEARRPPGPAAGVTAGRSAASSRREPASAFTAHRAGEAWLLAPAGSADPRALSFTAGLARDPVCTVLVADLPDGADQNTLEQLARAVPPGEGDLRLLFGRPPRPGAVRAARQLADRLGRTVTVASGILSPTPGGGLFIGPDGGTGWVRCAPGAPDEPDSRRFPKPSWESALPDVPHLLGTTMAEPLPAGLWLRPAQESTGLQEHRARLSGELRVSAELLTVVVGAPGEAEPPLADVVRLWNVLPERLRPDVRFVCYGAARLSGGRHFGDVLAQVVGEPVRLYNGLPRGTGPSDDVLRRGPDGSPGRPVRAREFVHLPPAGTTGPVPVPYAAAHGWPLDDLPETAPGTHLLADGTVVEVVPSGLWVRPPQDPPYAAEVRAAEPDSGHERILCDATREEELPRLRKLATDLMSSFPPELRAVVRLGVCRPTMPPGGWTAEEPGPRAGASSPPTPAGDGTRREPGGGAHPHTASGREHEGLLSVAAEILRRHPDLTPGSRDPDTVAALAAVLRRLAGGAEPDGELLRGGLHLLPAHRGSTGLRAILDEPMRRWYAGQSLIVDPDVCEASALGPGDAPGNTDFLIWSVNGRRTDLLDPLCPDRVLFPPGSRFRLLTARPAVPDVVMMRDLGPDETPAEPDPDLDRAAVRELTQAWHNWLGDART